MDGRGPAGARRRRRPGLVPIPNYRYRPVPLHHRSLKSKRTDALADVGLSWNVSELSTPGRGDTTFPSAQGKRAVRKTTDAAAHARPTSLVETLGSAGMNYPGTQVPTGGRGCAYSCCCRSCSRLTERHFMTTMDVNYKLNRKSIHKMHLL